MSGHVRLESVVTLGRNTHPLGEYRRIEAAARVDGRKGAGPGSDLAAAYALLGVGPGASPDEIKRTYRRLMAQHHPDKLAAKGLPEEMMQLAATKTAEIRKAYETVKRAKGF